MLLLAFKLCITPMLIGAVTLAGRRWGALVSGMLIGLPLTSGPISFILALEQGAPFASQAAIGGLLGQISICLFCLTYSHAAQYWRWPSSALAAITAFLAATAILNQAQWSFLPAFGALLATIGCVPHAMPKPAPTARGFAPPRWDLPARMLLATAFVLAITRVADTLGPQLSGLLAPFPVFGLVFAVFTHAQQGGKACIGVLRGIVLGSAAYAAFFAIIGFALPKLGVAASYPLAALAAVTTSGAFYLHNRRRRT